MKTFLLAALSLLSLNTQAQDKVVVVSTSGVETAYNIDEVQRLDFSGDALNVVATDATSTTYAFDEVQKIVFQSTATSISATPLATAARLTLTITADGSRLTVNGWDSAQTAALSIYATNGARVMHQSQWNGQGVDIAQLAHGIYVVKAGNHTAKFRK